MNTKHKIGLYFGSFNPIHNGHISVAIASLEDPKLNLDEVWFVVSPQNPEKKVALLCDEIHRLNMVKLAISSMGEFGKKMVASNVEFKMPRPSYTIDTLRKVEMSNLAYDFVIITGSDAFGGIPNWKEGEHILKYYTIIVHMRPGSNEDYLGKYAYSSNIISLTSQPQMEISSTEVRRRVEKGQPVSHLVPTAVAEYIEKNLLFIGDENGANRKVQTQ